jgi:MFS family permease
MLPGTIVNYRAAVGPAFAGIDRQWVVTAYALAFASLLLPGGRIGDMFSRKWVFITAWPDSPPPRPSAASLVFAAIAIAGALVKIRSSRPAAGLRRSHRQTRSPSPWSAAHR